MLHEVGLANFKSFGPKQTDFTLGQITVLIGPNGTGKSSLLQALLLLKQSAIQRTLNYAGPLIDLGTFRDVVHNQDVRREMKFSLSGRYISPPLRSSPLADIGLAFDYQATVGSSGVRDQSLAIYQGEKDNLVLYSEDLSGSRPVTISDRTVNVSRSTAFADPIDSTSARRGKPDDYDPILELLSPVRNVLLDYFLTPAIRGLHSRAYDIIPIPFSTDLTQAQHDMDQAKIVANLIAHRPEIVDLVSDAINCILGTSGALRHRLDSSRIVPELRKGKVGISLLHEAFGLNQLVAPLLSFFGAPPDSVIAIEEPEIHLHPRAQAAMSHFFARSVNQEEKQLILTTHSEHILMGFLTAVANGDLKSDELAIYELRTDGGATTATRLAVNEYGQIEGGLRGFMEVDLDEIGDFIKARIAHQTQ